MLFSILINGLKSVLTSDYPGVKIKRTHTDGSEYTKIESRRFNSVFQKFGAHQRIGWITTDSLSDTPVTKLTEELKASLFIHNRPVKKQIK